VELANVAYQLLPSSVPILSLEVPTTSAGRNSPSSTTRQFASGLSSSATGFHSIPRLNAFVHWYTSVPRKRARSASMPGIARAPSTK
jgi:hypothetical protein